MRSDTVYSGRGEKHAALFRRLKSIGFFLGMKSVGSFETLVPIYQTTRRHTPKHFAQYSHCFEKEESERSERRGFKNSLN